MCRQRIPLSKVRILRSVINHKTSICSLQLLPNPTHMLQYIQDVCMNPERNTICGVRLVRPQTKSLSLSLSRSVSLSLYIYIYTNV